MSFVNAAPGTMESTATNVAGIGATISKANAAAAAPTTGLAASAQDQVSAAVAAFFADHAQGYQALGAQAEAFHQDLVRTLTSNTTAYATTEADNAASTGDSGSAPREQVSHTEKQALANPAAATLRPQDDRPPVSEPGLRTGIESKSSGVAGMIGVGGVGRFDVPAGNLGGGNASRLSTGTAARTDGALSRRGESTVTRAAPLPAAKEPVGPPAGPTGTRPGRCAPAVILGARGAGSGGVAQRGGTAANGCSGGAGGFYSALNRPIPPAAARWNTGGIG